MDRIRTVGIVGVGLIGGSLGMAMRRRRLVDRVIGVDADAGALQIAQRRGAIDQAVPIERLAEADLVIIAVPPAAVVDTAGQAAAMMREGAILTDVASTKQHIVAQLDERLPGRVRYVGGHPMAGSQGHGPESADSLFARGVSNRRAVIAGYGESLLEVPATARLSGLLEGLLGGLDALLDGRTGAGELDYRVHGTIELEGFGSRPFDRSGKVRLAPERKPTPLPEGART